MWMWRWWWPWWSPPPPPSNKDARDGVNTNTYHHISSSTTMSLLSILRSSLYTRPPISSACYSLPSLPGAVFGAPILLPQHARRSVWSEVVRQIPSDDPNKVGQLTFEDPDLADARMLRALRAEGMSRAKRCRGGGDDWKHNCVSPRNEYLLILCALSFTTSTQHLYEEDPTLSDTRRSGWDVNALKWNVDIWECRRVWRNWRRTLSLSRITSRAIRSGGA